MTKQCENKIFLWSVIILGIMVFAMIIIGGLTRLTGSGLSIVDWRPITGVFPPLNHQQWMRVFHLYQQSPEYHHVNNGMSLEDFKAIFWLEYIHRLWGRIIGLVLLVPTYIIFINKRFIEHRLNIIALWVSGLGQGFMGWYMVKSGLINVPWVSPYRLTAHLCLALVIITIIVRILASFSRSTSMLPPKFMASKVLIAMALITLTIVMGGFTAGLHAGLIYNTFPLMGDTYVPAEIFHLSPLWKNIFENTATVQFIHRNLALITLTYIFIIGYHVMVSRADPKYKRLWMILLVATLIQVLLGISVILMVVPIWLAALHQAWAILLFAKCLWIYMTTK